MCMCEHPTINGTVKEWPVNPPNIQETDTLLLDLPGRCGGHLDSHAYHFRIVKTPGGGRALLVRHGGGDERIRLAGTTETSTAILIGSHSDDHAYWMCHMIYHAHADSRRETTRKNDAWWEKAAVEKRIQVRKVRGKSAYRVAVLAEGRA